jgi:predicted nucleic acid-binding protein
MAVLDSLATAIQTIDFETYSPFRMEASRRLGGRDPDDWPVLATALVLNCAIWTEDTDFFGAGVAVWTTDRVEIFLQELGGHHSQPTAARQKRQSGFIPLQRQDGITFSS